MNRRIIALSLVAWETMAWAQTASTGDPASKSSAPVSSYLLGPNDQISLVVDQLPEIGRRARKYHAAQVG